MGYFLTVRTKEGTLLRNCERYATLDDALEVVSANYLADDAVPHRWNGYFAVRGGQLMRLFLTQGTTAPLLREDIDRIDIMNERGLLETRTHGAKASH